MDAPVDEAETSEVETFFSKNGVDELMDGGPGEMGWDPEENGWTEELANELFASEELARLDSLRKDVLDRIDDALDRGVDEEELTDAFKDVLNETHNADSTAGEYLFQSNASADVYEEEVLAAHEALIAAYPLLINDDPDDMEDPDFGGIFNTGAPEVCEITDESIGDFFAHFDAIYEHETGSSAQEEDAFCGGWRNQLRLVGCLTLCGVAAPAGGAVAALCAWGCWCMLCTENSVVANVICPD